MNEGQRSRAAPQTAKSAPASSSPALRATPPDGTCWQTLPLGRDVTLIIRDPNGLVAFNKPAGILSHPNEPRDQSRSLLTARYNTDGEYYEWDTGNAVCGLRFAESQIGRTARTAEEKHTPLASANLNSELQTPLPEPQAGTPPRHLRLWLLNRLDSATSGVILAATTEKLALEIRALFRERHISKTYAALVFGHPPEKTQDWRDRLAVQKRGGQIRAAARAGNIPAESRMTLLRTRRDSPAASGAPISLLQLEPKTGRSHQLRVQCARRRLPIIGDATYGDFHANRDFARRTGEKRLFLHSLEIRFDYTHNGRACSFRAEAGLPAAFAAHL